MDLDEFKNEKFESKPGPSLLKLETTLKSKENVNEIKVFQCSLCIFQEQYEYFGRNPPHTGKYILNEDCYLIEDPFYPPKQSKFIILGAHCIKCKKPICKDTNCSLYFDGTYCIICAKSQKTFFPVSVQEKLNRILQLYNLFYYIPLKQVKL